MKRKRSTLQNREEGNVQMGMSRRGEEEQPTSQQVKDGMGQRKEREERKRSRPKTRREVDER